MAARHSLVPGLHFRSLAGAVALALAAESAAQPTADPSLEEITVTGTRIRRTDGMAEPVPVTTLSLEELSVFDPGSTIAE